MSLACPAGATVALPGPGGCGKSALLVFMIPLLGIGFVPACAALFLYSLLPLIRNAGA